ncbi:DUF4432 family protein [Rhizobiaceae bacterium BDR2-2]|uniref:DUF4432 family protein n=1 Tax=Ectorhizobium quercum TaxID=2965071 RepID=A0AAE3MZE0_9HYPH|nr:DUF4432 family protein [Ectorhizobium quercum]MCX8996495.1 DUF4432 family protein [Ectorhizobium quercum]
MIEFSAARGPVLFLDRASVLDIGKLFVAGRDVSPGRAIPDDGDPRIDHSLEGFLFTCGPDHIRHPEPVEGASDGSLYPLHGSFSASPAENVLMECCGDDAVCRGEVPVRLASGGHARLYRVWRIDGATGEVFLEDRLVNDGARPFAPMLMYHMNLAAGLLDAGTRLQGDMLEGGSLPWAFGEGDGGVFCIPAGEAGQAEVRLGPVAALSGLTLRVRFATATLPFLQVWRNQSAPADVLGIEPASHRWTGRSELATRGELVALQPGEALDYRLSFAFISGE